MASCQYVAAGFPGADALDQSGVKQRLHQLDRALFWSLRAPPKFPLAPCFYDPAIVAITAPALGATPVLLAWNRRRIFALVSRLAPVSVATPRRHIPASRSNPRLRAARHPTPRNSAGGRPNNIHPRKKCGACQSRADTTPTKPASGLSVRCRRRKGVWPQNDNARWLRVVQSGVRFSTSGGCSKAIIAHIQLSSLGATASSIPASACLPKALATASESSCTSSECTFRHFMTMICTPRFL
jgi:hypothetical protein